MKKVLFLSSWQESDFITDQATAIQRQMEIKFFDCSHSFSLIPRKFRTRIQAHRILKGCKTNKWMPDLIHAHVAYPAGVIAQKLKVSLKVPVILTEHTGPIDLLVPYFSSPQAFDKHFSGYDHIVCVSGFLKRKIQDRNPALPAISVIGNIVGSVFFSTPIHFNVSQQSALFAGGFTPEKGIPELIEALQKFDQLLSTPFEMNLIGSGPLKETLYEKKDTFQKIKMKFYIGDRDLVCQLLNQVSFLVLPSRIETFSLVAAEALAMGRPVIGFDCGGPSDFISSDRGVLLSKRDPLDLAKGMLDLSTESKWRLTPEASEKRRAFAQNLYSDEAILNKIYALYNSIL